MRITSNQMAVLVGTVLGAGYLQKTGKFNARLRLEHKLDHKEYLLWKAKMLPKLFQGKFTTLERVHPVTHKKYAYARWQSNSTPSLGKLRQIFYPEGKKKIPQDLAKWLNSPLALATWYMDDGYYYERDRCAYLYLGRVGKKEAEIAQETLKRNFKLVTKVLDKKDKGFVLYFTPLELLKLKKIIEPYLQPVMSYKLPS